MDGDPAVEPALDSFSLFLPLPYRVSLIIVLGKKLAPCNLLHVVLVPNKQQASGHGE
jgi:hypothetical protein